MSQIIAFCTNSNVFNENNIFNKNVAEKYPGSMWLPFFFEFCNNKGLTVVTGDIALGLIKANKVNSNNVFIIQEENSLHAIELAKLGSKQAVLICLESPIYAPKFYRNIISISKNFEFKILFSGILTTINDSKRSDILFFPSLDASHFFTTKVEWNQKKFLTMVASNKYWRPIRPFQFKIKTIAGLVKDAIKFLISPFSHMLLRKQLFDKRLEALIYFGKMHKLDLYGSNWHDLSLIPRKYRISLGQVIQSISPRKCLNKIETISHYKFAICFENLSYPGYVTEKIIDCISAGVIPIYLGAPDIEEFVPASTFIDFRKFKRMELLLQYLENMSEPDALVFIQAGKDFLNTLKAEKYSYQYFAMNILSKINTLII